MKTPKLLFSFFVVLFIFTTALAHSNYFGYARDRGMVISVSPDKNPAKTGDTVTFSGSIRVYNKDKDHKYSKNKYSLLEEFRKEGLDIVATFPSEAFDISNNLIFSSSSENEIRFSYTAQAINPADLNQFSIKVYNNHHEREVLKKLALTRAKLERRLQALYQLKSKSHKEIWSEKARAYLDKQVQLLESISQKISAKLNSNEDLIAENTFAPQIDNLTASSSRISSVMNKYRFVISSEIGTAIEGMKTKITASVTNLRNSSEHDDEDHDEDDKNKVAQFSFNNQALFTSAAQKLEGGESISYSYTTGSLLTNAADDFSVALYIAEKYKLNKRIGWVTQKIPVLNDATKPIWLAESSPNNSIGTLYVQALDYVNLKAFDEFGRIDENSFASKLSGTTVSGETVDQELSQSFSVLKLGDGWEYLFSKDLNPLQEGLYKLESSVKDLAANASALNIIEFRIDRTAPAVDLKLTSSALTNKMTSDITVIVNDLSPTITSVYVNENLIFSTDQVSFPAAVNLPSEGQNIIKVISKDMAGNISLVKTAEVVRDTIPATLTLSMPKENDYVNGVQFNIAGSASEQIISAKINGSTLVIGADKIAFSGVFTSLKEGALSLDFETTDLAGNIGHQLLNVNVVLKALNPELLSLFLDPSSNKLFLKGAAGATRPGISVYASCSLFNSNQSVGGTDGSFLIELEPCTKVEVSAYDPLIDKKEVATLHFGSSDGNVLAGSIRDINDMPLPNATVTMVGTGVTVYTDENGIFKFKQDQFGGKSVYGDQNLLIDGRTISQATGSDQRKFSIVQVAITISLNEKNVLQRPIYLAPVVMDGTETQVSISSGAVVTSPHAPGVELDIPANSAIFPDGSSQTAISIQEIDSSKTTILPIAAAMPKTVVALEPSGTTFSKPVELTLPNKNEFPPKMQMAVLLMNSKTGKWEVGGSAVVSDNGASIVTKPNQGIRHFSLAYAAPIGPTVRQIGAQDKPGADTFNGAATTQISLPSFKSLGESVSLGLTYKSSWAKPTALVTNLFDMSTRRVDITIPEQNGSYVDKVKVNVPYCSLPTPLFVSVSAEDLKCYDRYEEYLYDIQYKISYKNTQSVLTPDKIVATFQTGNLKTPENDPNLTFTGLPELAAVSYAMELKDPQTQNYFPTGIHPYTAHYDLHFKEMVVGTRKIEQKVNLGDPQISEESFELDPENKVFPQDLSESLFVQNYTTSSAGRGWRINGPQRLVNPSGDRIMIEEEAGNIATYSLANTIDTVADLNGKAELSKGVGLNRWPHAQFMNSSGTTYQQVDLTSGAISSIASPFPLTGEIGGYDYYNYTKTVITPNWECLHHDWLRRCDEWGYKYYYYYYPTSSCSKNKFSYTIASQPSQFLMSPSGELYGLDYGRSSVFAAQGGTSRMIGGGLNSSPNFANYYQSQKDDNRQQILSFCNSTLGMNCSSIQNEKYDLVNQPSSCGNPINSSGYVPNTADLNNPMGIAIGTEPNTIIIADSGHHQIKLLNTLTGQSTVIAGTGRVADSTTTSDALSHDIFYPRGVVYDTYGNLYISSKGGYVRRMDTFGNIQVIAGDPVNGKIIDSGDAREMKLVEPYGLVVDSVRNYLYVADTGQNRVIRIDLSNLEAKTVAGNRSPGFSGDGNSALEASLNSPSHLGLDPNGNLLIADAGNNRIRRVVFQSTSLGTLAFSPTSDDNSRLYRNSNGTWTRAYRSGAAVYFDTLGRQYAAIDPQGRTTEFLYDSESRLTQIKDPVGQTIQYNYSGNRLSSIIDPAGRETSFSYDFNGDLVRVRYPDGATKKFEYDSTGLLISEINENGSEVQYVYNTQNRIEKVIKPDATNVKISDSGSQTTGGGELKKAEDAKSSITDSNGNTTELAKDFQGYISTITDAKGRVTKIKRDLKGRPIEITDVDGSVIQNTYDSVYGDVIKTTNVTLDITEQTQYNIYGQVVKRTDPYGKISTKEYNSKKQLIKETAPDGKYATYEYNGLGLIIKKSVFNASNELKNQISYDYDSKGQLIKQTDLNGKYSTYTYDLAGNVLTSTSNIDGSTQSTTQYEYDQKNRLTKVISPKGEVTQYSYSPAGELIQITDPKNKVTSFQYNINGQLIKKIDPIGQAYELGYDANGNLLTEKDPAGQIKQYAYNELNKVTQVQTADDQIYYQYNIKDEVIQIANNTAVINYARDAKQRIIQEEVSGSNYPSHVLNLEYSKNDLRTSLQSNYQNISYSYNTNNYQLLGITSSATGSYGFAYDSANRLTQISRPGSVTNYSFDIGSNLTKISHQKSGTEIGFHEYSYDLRNYITQKRSPASTLSYGYDVNGQLVSANKDEDVNQNESFSYDALGNRLTYNGVTSTYDNTGQRIQDDGSYTYVYDANGNIIYKQNKSNGISYTFEYSALNQLKKATVTSTPLNGNVLKTIEYKYDPVGRRISRQVTDFEDSTKSKTQKFYYDGDNIIAELDESNNLAASYTHSPLRPDDILGAKFTSSAVGNGLAASAGYVYYLKDHLNTVNEITNAVGDIVQRMEYSAFGTIRSVKNSAGTEVGFANAPVRSSFTYTGREYEPELGMYYYRARYYDPSMGRFLQQDPDPGKLALPSTAINKYIYTGNMPTMYGDFTGKDWLGNLFVGIVAFAAAVVFGPLAAAAILGASANIVAFAIVSTVMGAVVGGVVGGITNRAIGNGTFQEGFQIGAIAGALGGLTGGIGLYGSRAELFDKASNLIDPITKPITKFFGSQKSILPLSANSAFSITAGAASFTYDQFKKPCAEGYSYDWKKNKCELSSIPIPIPDPSLD